MKYLIAALTLAASIAHAQQCTTLVYQGAPLTVTNVPANMPTPFQFMPLVGVVTLPAALTPGMNQTVTPIAFDFAPEDLRLILPDPNGWKANGGTHFVSPSPSFSFTVDAAGMLRSEER